MSDLISRQAALKGTVVLDHIPDGWRVIVGANNTPNGYCFICNNQSRFSGDYRHALVSEDVANEWRNNNT